MNIFQINNKIKDESMKNKTKKEKINGSFKSQEERMNNFNTLLNINTNRKENSEFELLKNKILTLENELIALKYSNMPNKFNQEKIYSLEDNIMNLKTSLESGNFKNIIKDNNNNQNTLKRSKSANKINSKASKLNKITTTIWSPRITKIQKENEDMKSEIYKLQNKIQHSQDNLYYSKFENRGIPYKFSEIELWKNRYELLRKHIYDSIKNIQYEIKNDQEKNQTNIVNLQNQNNEEVKNLKIVYENVLYNHDQEMNNLKQENADLIKRLSKVTNIVKPNAFKNFKK